MAKRSKHQAPPQERSNGKGNGKQAIVVTDPAMTVERAAKRVGAEVIIALHQMPQENLSP